MNQAFAAASVLFLVYVSQCFGTAPLSCAVFLLNDRLKGRVLCRYWDTGPGGRRIFLLNPFLPHVGAVYADRVPFAVRHREGAEDIWLEALSADGDKREALTFPEAHNIFALGKHVNVDGRKFVTMRSEACAAATAEFLQRVRRTASEGRIAVLRENFRARFRLKDLNERLETYAKSSAHLQSVCFALFFFVFLLGPAALFFLGLHRTWFALLLYLSLSCASITWFFAAAYRRIYPQKRGWPLQYMTTIALSPFAAIRANDLLVAELLAEFHPVAVGRLLLEEEEFRRFAGSELRKARFLYRDDFMAGVLEEFLKQNGVDLESLLGAPRREDGASRTYCPVCLTQYVVESGNCKDCDETELVRWG